MRLIAMVAALASTGGCVLLGPAAVNVPSLRETAAVSQIGDAADDPAIWVASDPSHSRIVATQKKGGLYVFDLQGRIAQEVSGGQPNNVDLRPSFAWPEGDAPIVGASDRADNTLVLWRFDAAKGEIESTVRARIPTGFEEVYGFCFGAVGGKTLAAATDKDGDVGVWRLRPEGEAVAGEKLGGFALGSIAEGCVIDDANGVLYVAQEEVGIWRIALSDLSGARTLVDEVGDGVLVKDVEGLTLYAAADGGGYLIASVQGGNRYAVYERGGSNAYAGTFKIGASADGAADRVSGTDGIDVTSSPLGPDFPQGMLVAQDDENTAPNELQNFKLVSWAVIAAALARD